MLSILSVENDLNWSWSFGLQSLKDRLDWDICRVRRIPACHIADDLVDHFDVTLLQNLDSIQLVRKNYQKVVSRIGGLHVDRKNPPTRYDKWLKKCGYIIATNNNLLKIAERVNKNSKLIPAGVDLELFKPADRPDRKFTVGFAGNIWGTGKLYKGWKYYSNMLDRLYGTIDHKECLFYHSQIPHKDMPKEFYHKIDCLILPSLGEGCSNVTTEALACGVPVLTTKVGYHGEMLRNYQECLFIERDVGHIISMVRLLKASPSLWEQISKQGRTFAEKNHDIIDAARRYNKVFQHIIKGV